MSNGIPDGATHQHYKGDYYKVLVDGVHDANNGHDYDRLTVVYQNCAEGYIAMRYADEFYDSVEVDGKSVPRFRPLAQDQDKES